MSSTPTSIARKGARQLFPNRSFDQNNENNNSFLLSMSAPFACGPHNDKELRLDVANDCINDIDNAIVPTINGDHSTTSNVEENNDNNSNILIMQPPVHLQKHDIFNLYRDKRFMADHFNESAASSILNLSVDSMLDSPMYKERHLKLADAEKGLEVFGRQLAREQNIKWKEYWSFLGSFVDIGSETGLKMLENHLKDNKETRDGVECQPPTKTSHNLSVSSLCGALDKLNFRESRSLTNLRNCNNNNVYDSSSLASNNEAIQSPNAFTAYLCAEKACQVYAKRMTKIIVQNLNSVISINDSLKSELKRLKSLVWSYSEDIRFFAVNFQSTHSRFANLIVAYLKYENETELIQIRDLLTQIHQTTQRLIDTVNDIYSPRSESATSNLQLDCLLKFLLHYLSDAGEHDVIVLQFPLYLINRFGSNR